MKGSIKFAIALWITIGVYLAVNWTEWNSLNNFFLILHLTCTGAAILMDYVNYQIKDPYLIGKYNPLNIMVVLFRKAVQFLDKIMD